MPLAQPVATTTLVVVVAIIVEQEYFQVSVVSSLPSPLVSPEINLTGRKYRQPSYVRHRNCSNIMKRVNYKSQHPDRMATPRTGTLTTLIKGGTGGTAIGAPYRYW